MRNLITPLLTLCLGLILTGANAQTLVDWDPISDLFDANPTYPTAHGTQILDSVRKIGFDVVGGASPDPSLSIWDWNVDQLNLALTTWGEDRWLTYSASGLTIGDKYVIKLVTEGSNGWTFMKINLDGWETGETPQTIWNTENYDVTGYTVHADAIPNPSSSDPLTIIDTIEVTNENMTFGIGTSTNGGVLYIIGWSITKVGGSVPVPVTSVELDDDAETLEIGDDYTLTATVLPVDADDPSVTWTTEDGAIATVSQDGLVTAVAEGTVDIIVTSNENADLADTCVITVIPVDVTGVEIEGRPVGDSIVEGSQVTLTAVVTPDNATNPSVTWSTSDEAVATVVDGVVNAVANGNTTITLISDDDNSITDSFILKVYGPTPVTSVELDDDTETLEIGDEYTLTATVLPANADDPSVTWTTEDDAIATVTQNGLVTAVAEGTVDIIVTSNENAQLADTCVITVIPVDVTGVEIGGRPVNDSLAIGDEVTLTATVTPDNATNPAVTWSTSDATIATVVDGLVSGLSSGIITITLISDDDNSITDSFVLEVYDDSNPVISVELDDDAETLEIGDEYTLTATVLPVDADDPSVTWTTEDDAIATVTQNGLVTAVAEGTVDIIVTSNENTDLADTCVITVIPVEVTGVELGGRPTNDSLVIGGEVTLTATVTPDNATNPAVTWSSSDATVATVTDGVVSGLVAGTTTITLTSEDDNTITDSFILTVYKEPVTITDIRINADPDSVKVGSAINLSIVITPSNPDDTSVTWSTSDASIATVSNGVVTGIAQGTVTVSVQSTAVPSVNDNITIKVYEIASTISENDMGSLTAYPNPTNGIFTIENSAGISSYSLISLTGQTIISTEAAGENTLNVDISNIANGAYLVKVVNISGKVSIFKIVKQ